MISTSGEFVTLTRFLASGTAGGFKREVKIMKMMSNTNSTSVKGVMLMVDMTSSSGAAPTTDIEFAFSLRGSNSARLLLRDEPDVVVAGLPRRIQDLDDRVVARVLVGDQRHVRRVPLIRMGAMERNRVGHDIVEVL